MMSVACSCLGLLETMERYFCATFTFFFPLEYCSLRCRFFATSSPSQSCLTATVTIRGRNFSCGMITFTGCRITTFGFLAGFPASLCTFRFLIVSTILLCRFFLSSLLMFSVGMLNLSWSLSPNGSTDSKSSVAPSSDSETGMASDSRCHFSL